MKTLIQTSKVLILSIAILSVAGYAQAVWSDPKENPTGGNTSTPINVSTSNQDKLGGFGAAALVGGIITSPEFCLTNDRCITTWPTGGGGDVDITNLQNRVTGECSIGQSIIKINADGTVVCGDAENNLPKGQYCGYIRVAQQRGTTPAPDDGSITCDVNGVSYYPGIYECKYLDTDMTGSCTSTRKLGCPTGFSESQIGTADAISNNFRGDDMSAIKTYSCIKT